MTNTERVDLLNIALMVVAWLVALWLPFQLFLFAYAALGPLHYLTEISWLHDRGYFVDRERTAQGRKALVAWLVLVAVTMVVLIYGMIAERVLGDAPWPGWEVGLTCLVFLGAALVVLRDRPMSGAIVLVAAPLLPLLLFGSGFYAAFAFFLLTLIHVLLFTAMFLLHGALRSGSRWGLASCAVYLGCLASLFVVAPGAGPVAAWLRESYDPFTTLNAQLIRAFGYGHARDLSEVFESRGGLVVMRLIAFAYTYHYLNWFTKTSVIEWHRVSRPRAAAILTAWAVAVGIYAWNFAIGFIVLYCLSALHVLLELPLNHRTIGGIGSELARRLAPPAQVAAPARSGGPPKRKARSRH